MITRTRRSRGRRSFKFFCHGFARIHTNRKLARIDFFAVANAENENDESVILEGTDQAIIADPVSPEFA
jgi:hypothetical protein